MRDWECGDAKKDKLITEFEDPGGPGGFSCGARGSPADCWMHALCSANAPCMFGGSSFTRSWRYVAPRRKKLRSSASDQQFVLQAEKVLAGS